MSIEIKDIIDDIKTTPFFKERLDIFLKQSLQRIFSIKKDEKEEIFSIKELLEISNIFSLSSDKDDLRISYLIAIYTWLNYESIYQEIIEPINLILSRLSNFPAKTLLSEYNNVVTIKKKEVSEGKNLFVSLENLGREFENKVPFIRNLILTDFQKKLWDYLESNNSVSFSAPTSAGKSFILKQFVVKKIKENSQFKILYILPSRALINETNYDLKEFLKKENVNEEVLLTSIPTIKMTSHKVIYVLTQERATILLEQDPKILFDLIIVDEAQSISNNQRGIILQNLLQNVFEKNPNTPVVFSSPFVKNPEIFEKIYKKDIKNIPDNTNNVIQNLITASVENNNIELNLVNERNIYLGSIKSKQNGYNLPKKKNRLAFLAKELTLGTDKSIIYANGPAEAEEIAQLLYDALEPIKINNNLKDLSRYIKSHLHNQFSLALFLTRGVAFHYGDLPSNIRIGIEDEFKNPNGDIKFIVCTSTLLEGVNLPAKNIFIENPHKGKEKDALPLSKHEFWNLAGRAGRLTKDFYGNVFLVNFSEWQENPLEGEKQREIKSALSQVLCEKYDIIKEYLKNGSLGTNNFGEIESTVNTIYSKYKNNMLDLFFGNSPLQLDFNKQLELKELLKNLDKKITLPESIVKKNPHISVLSQQALFNYFLIKYQDGKLSECEPLHPNQENNKLNLEQIFYRINNHFFPESQRKWMIPYIRKISMNCIFWMRGLPISMMINNNVERKRSLSVRRVPNINSCVREILKQIEQDIRFKFSINTKCYIDLLEYCWKINGVEKQLIPIHLFLEMGACNQTMISLMGIGLSRPTSGKLEEHIFNKELTEEDAYKWLKNNKDNLIPFGVTGLTLKEVNKFL